MQRVISHSETSAFLDCQAKWDFGYGGRLAGDALKGKDAPVNLKRGRAWGRGVAAFHSYPLALDGGDFDLAKAAGREAIVVALEEEAIKLQEVGLYVEDDHQDLQDWLLAVFDHYVATTEFLPVDRLEHEVLVPLPSRSGKGDSNRYFLQALFDAMHRDDEGRLWLVEYKLRGELSSLEQLAKSPQVRRYAWAWRRETGEELAGIIVDERLNALPKAARWVQGKKKGVGKYVEEWKDGRKVEKWMVPSSAKDQITSPDLYEAACAEAGVEVDTEVVEALAQRRWQQREPIFLTVDELDEAGEELVSLGRQVKALDSGEVFPVRNPSKARCPGCWFKEICDTPKDRDLVDAHFHRVPPKRDRPPQSQKQEAVA